MISDDADDPTDAPALVVLTELGRDAAEVHSRAELDEGLDALRALFARRLARRCRLVRLALVGATATTCLLVALKLTSVKHAQVSEPPVAVSRIDGGTELEGGYLAQSGAVGVKVIFSEGSTFALTPGARGRLRSVARDGAHLAVEHGTASLEITQSRTHRWLVEAGPFLVTVKGTVFTVSWDPASERFELRLRHGRVVVSGPVVNGGIALEAGQRLVVSLPRAETLITREPPGEVAPAPIDVAALAPAPPSAAPRRAPSTAARPASASPAKGARTRRWAADLASGNWDRILADADGDGIDATLEHADREELFALAAAARYRRRTDLARSALMAERRRFPREARSLDALFLLGRVEELRERGTAAQAIAWYDEYLNQAPTGPYAAEALGRKMILTNDAAGPERARSIAREYLLRFPTGSHAGAAHALERAP
jgi:hypothetical protein